MRRLIPLVVLFWWLPSTGASMTFSTPIPGLIGDVDFARSERASADFDFGQAFQSIQSISIEIEAQVFAREFESCGTPSNPIPCTPQTELLGFYAHVDDGNEPLRLGFSRGLSFFNGSATEGYGIDSASFTEFGVPSGWDFLLQGSGRIHLFWNSFFGNPDLIVRNNIEPSGEIFSARLVIDATPIPEPSTGLLLGLGLAMLARRPIDP